MKYLAITAATILAIVTAFGDVVSPKSTTENSTTTTIVADGATPGIWSQDYAACIKLAQEKNLPILINFTGSDWCGWCKLMDEKVFSTDEWKNWAKDNIILAYINFPNDKSLVPEKFQKRNNQLAKQFSVEGYPDFRIIDCDGKTEIGQLGASQGATPRNFIAQIKKILLLKFSKMDLSTKLSTDEFQKLKALEKKADEQKAKYDKELAIAQKEMVKIYEKLNRTKDKDAKDKLNAEIEKLGKEYDAKFEALTKEMNATSDEIDEILKKVK